jgi:OOP family OmpA-OmpF porin
MIDSDGDGVPDHKDACPEEAGITIDGCPLDCSTCGTPCEGQILPKVIFRTGSSKISSSDDAMMYLMADKLRNCPDKKISVVGYADNGVKSKANQRLSLSRANAVIDFLAEKYGISRDRFEAEAGTTDDNNKKTVEVQMK